MSDSIKTRITTDIQKAKEEGKFRSERVREIVKIAVAQAISEFKEGSNEIRSIVKDAVSAVIENLKETGGEVKEEVTASIEGVIEAISNPKRESIAKTQEELKKLQAQIDAEETELQLQIDTVLSDIEETHKDTKSNTKAAVESAIKTLKNSEEVALLQKRYAQLQAQLAIIKANLSARYGERYEDVKIHLDDAKNWYEQAQPKADELADKVNHKRTEFENKLGEAGTALAKKEQRVRQLLRELWHSLREASPEK